MSDSNHEDFQFDEDRFIMLYDFYSEPRETVINLQRVDVSPAKSDENYRGEFAESLHVRRMDEVGATGNQQGGLDIQGLSVVAGENTPADTATPTEVHCVSRGDGLSHARGETRIL